MNMIRKLFFVLIVFSLGSGIILGLVLLPAKAQSTEISGRHLVFLPYTDQSDVNLNGFPTIEARFLLMENGVPSRENITVDMLSLFEDDYKITQIQYRPKTQPIHLTIIVDAESIYDLGKNISPGPGLEDVPDTMKLAEDIRKMVGNDDHFQLCFTLGMPSCRNQTAQSFQRLYYGMIEDFPEPNGNTQERVTPLQEIVELAMLDAEKTYQTPVIALIRTPRVDGQQRGIPDISEPVLAALTAQNGLFVVLDRLYKPLYQPELTDYLKRQGAYYYSVVGVIDDNESCNSFNECIQQHIENSRPKEHVVTYQSRLFQDQNPHKLTIQLELTPNANDEPLVGATEFDFSLTPAQSELQPYVRWINSFLVIVAPFFLILILVFSADTYQDEK